MTSEEISKLSEFELNKAIWLKVKNPNHHYKDCRVIGYCVLWNELMPLVVEHGITLYKYMSCGGWQAFLGTPGNLEISIQNKNPQRALAECLLMVLIEKEDDDDNR